MVKGTLMMTQHFLKLLGGESTGYIINITSAGGVFFTPGPDSYGMCKLLELQMQRYIAALNPNVVATALHPGSILTNITAPAFVRMSKDTFELAGGTAVWLATEEARFMNGRYMSVNWSVEELTQRRKEIIERDLLTMELKGHFGQQNRGALKV
jgi:NAD(P)-dependent dehydrogenase (short-subunit alcohol dehydrogenase family)